MKPEDFSATKMVSQNHKGGKGVNNDTNKKLSLLGPVLIQGDGAGGGAHREEN